MLLACRRARRASGLFRGFPRRLRARRRRRLEFATFPRARDSGICYFFALFRRNPKRVSAGMHACGIAATALHSEHGRIVSESNRQNACLPAFPIRFVILSRFRYQFEDSSGAAAERRGRRTFLALRAR